MKHTLPFLIMTFLLLGIYACQQDSTYIYEVNTEDVLPVTAGKTKLKTPEQYVAILHVNLFQKPLSASQIYDISRVILSIGDKELANELVISNFMNKEGVILPTDEEMRADIGTFIDKTYNRFFIRYPTELEKEYFIQYIKARPDVSPELIYYAFAISNEYQYY